MSDLAIFVKILHPSITFILRNDFTCIFDDNLVRLKATITPDTMPTIKGFNNLNPTIIFPPGLGPLPKIFEAAVCAVVGSNIAVRVVALVEHKSVEALFTASALQCTNTL